MKNNQLEQKLLPNPTRPKSLIYAPRKRFNKNFRQQQNDNYSQQSLQFEQCLSEDGNDDKMYYSNIETTKNKFNFRQLKEEIKQKSRMIQDSDQEQQYFEPQLINNESVHNLLNLQFKNRNFNSQSLQDAHLKLRNNSNIKQTRKKTLNMRIFGLKNNVLRILFWFNLIFNLIFRAGLIVLLIFLIIDQKYIWLIGVVLGLEGFAIFLYTIAIHKLLYTKSSQISVYFQKQFYPEKHYDQINLDRLMRKHFTFQNMCKNLNRYFNPFTRFRKNMKASVIRQQIYKRMEVILVFVPLTIIVLINDQFMDFDEEYYSQTFIGVVFCCEIIRLVFHYLIIYIVS